MLVTRIQKLKTKLSSIIPNENQGSGTLSVNLLSDLGFFINSYLKLLTIDNVPDVSFYDQIDKFFKKLSLYPIEELDHLYGISIQVANQNCYLVEILLDCLLFPIDLEEKLLALANWQQQLLKDITTLFSAVTEGNLVEVMAFIKSGININVVNEDHQSLLHVVSDIVVAHYLIKEGIDLTIQDNWGDTPLHSAAKRNNLTLTMRLLEEKNIPLDRKNELGNTALHIAAHQQYNEHIKEQTLFFITGHKPQFENLIIINTLLKNGANPNEINHFGYTPLHLAVACHHNCFGSKISMFNPDYLLIKKKVDLLCSNKANPNLKTYSNKLIPTKAHYSNKKFNIYDNCTALDILYFHNIGEGERQARLKVEIAKILTSKGLNFNKRIDLLYAFTKSGDLAGLEFFINYGQDISQDELTLLLFNLFYWQSDRLNWRKSGKACADLLLDAGADCNKVMCLEKEDGSTIDVLPECYAKTNSFLEICDEAIEYLESYREGSQRSFLVASL